MDPLTQGVLGATYAQSFIKSKGHHKYALFFGFLSGMAADLDVLIRSESDSLLFLEYHRHFTHSLIFIPFGALICSLLFYYLSKKNLSFKYIYFYSVLGYATHALLDTCTSYGTQLLWPFSNTRFAWNNISIVDPLFTLPLLALVILTFKKKNNLFSKIAIIYGLFYLGLGVFQRERVIDKARELAKSRNHHPLTIEAKPTFGNLILWKVFYEHTGYYYVDAIRATNKFKIIRGTKIKKYKRNEDHPQLIAGSTLSNDIDRFKWFSGGYISVDPKDPNKLIDIRYSIIPNEVEALWGIQINLENQHSHAIYQTYRKMNKDLRTEFFKMLVL